MSEVAEARKRKTMAELIQNGFGTVVSRLLIMGMPFAFGGALWAGKTIVELEGEKVLSAIERIDHRIDALDTTQQAANARLTTIETRQADQGARLEGLRDRFEDSRGRIR